MTIDFICGVLAELFDSPCDFSPMDEYMFQDEYCEHHCGKVEDKDCWKRYFEKRWADRKTEPLDKDTNVRSKDCETCGTSWLLCKYCIEEDSMWTPKTEPQSMVIPRKGCHRPIELPCHTEQGDEYCKNCVYWHEDFEGIAYGKVESESQTERSE